MTLLISSGLEGVGLDLEGGGHDTFARPTKGLFLLNSIPNYHFRVLGGLRLASRIPSTAFLGIYCHGSVYKEYMHETSSLPMIKSTIQVRCLSMVWGFRLGSNGQEE